MPLPLPIALQLYTIRDVMSRDFEGTLEAVAGIGYRQVEFAGLYDRAPKVVKALCDKLGLQPVSFHVGLDAVRPSKIEETITLAKTLDARYIVIPAAPGDLRNADGYRQIAQVLTHAQDTAGASGLRICYHNHAFEYDKNPDGTNGMDILFGNADTKTNYASELDVYWVTKGGADPVTTINKYAGRVPLLHIKDMANTPDKGFAEVGTGIINFQNILAVASGAGVKHLIVEQDAGWIGADPMKSVKLSYENLKKLVG
jgi:sugar phosphate isomerase/epimerase